MSEQPDAWRDERTGRLYLNGRKHPANSVWHAYDGDSDCTPLWLMDAADREKAVQQAVGEVVDRVQVAFSGDEFEENAAAAAQEGEWSWFRWLARTTVRAALTEAQP